MAYETGLGGSRASKDAAKGFYFDAQGFIPASGIAFNIVDITEGGDHPNLLAWGTNTKRAVAISTEGYTGTLTASGSFTLTIANGVITDVA
jgi:hypothetical protein